LRVAVIDTSPLINLTHLELALELNLFFDRIYVPRAVHRELNKKGRFRYRLNKLYRTGFFVRCMLADSVSVMLLRAELDEGESEAIVQAREQQAPYLIADDRRAREVAELMGRRCVGTLRLRARLGLEHRAEETSRLVAILRRDLEFRATDDVVRQAIDLASQPI
jgi:predicted nucleic acid-binding protein